MMECNNFMMECNYFKNYKNVIILKIIIKNYKFKL